MLYGVVDLARASGGDSIRDAMNQIGVPGSGKPDGLGKDGWHSRNAPRPCKPSFTNCRRESEPRNPRATSCICATFSRESGTRPDRFTALFHKKAGSRYQVERAHWLQSVRAVCAIRLEAPENRHKNAAEQLKETSVHGEDSLSLDAGVHLPYKHGGIATAPVLITDAANKF